MSFWVPKKSAIIFGKVIRPKVYGQKNPNEFESTRSSSPRII